MRRNLVKTLVATVVGVLLVPLGGISMPASAAVSPPTLSTPLDGTAVTKNTELTWGRVIGAMKYEVQVAGSADFAAPLKFTQSTLNTTATPPNDLAVGTYFWHVRAYDAASVAGAYSSTWVFEKLNAEAPTGLQPPEGGRAGGLPLRYAFDPLILSWDAMPGIKTYEVQIDDDALFVGAPTPTSTNNTSFTPPNPPLRTTFYWHVRGKSSQSVPTQWSDTRSFSMTWDSVPTLSTPENVALPTIEEVVLVWAALPGASGYQLQISPDVEFNAPIGGTRVVNGTSFAPATTLPNGSYYWRVRGLTTSSTPEPSNWSATWVFTRAWPAATVETRPRGTELSDAFRQVTLVSPADGNYTTFKEPTFSWFPQREASHYELWVGSDFNFSPYTYATCLTNHTTFTSYRLTPTSGPMCPAATGKVTFWKVRAVDGPATSPPVYGVWSETRSFLYEPTINTGGVVQLSPTDSATVSLPILTWEPVADIAQYKVTIDPDGTCATITAFTYNTTYVPETLNSTCAGTFAWTVQSVEANGAMSRLPSLASWPRFSMAAATPGNDLEPVATAANTTDPYRPPLMTWQPQQDAATYSVWVSVQGANSWLKMHTKTTQPGFAYTGLNTNLSSLLPPGGYDFYVEAYDDRSVSIGTSGYHSFQISSLPATVLTSPTNCPLESQSCPVRHDTPTLDWEPVRGAGFYLVYLATDPNFTNITRTWATQHDTLTPVESLPDSQAGQATYWFVRPCYKADACGPDGTVLGSTHAYAFRKRSFEVTPATPLAGATVADEVVFTWQDYLKTNQEQGGAVNEVVTQEARNYKVEVSTTKEFTNIIDTSPLVDQTRYEAQSKTYPDGPLFWRVQAYDASGNPLTTSDSNPGGTSDPIEFTKKSPGPTLTVPANGASVSSAPVLTWAAKTFAETYLVEVYKYPLSPLADTNRVVSISTRATVAIPTTSLAPGDYIWRVRRLDTNALPGAWTADTNDDMWRFTVKAAAANLIAPTDGKVVTNNDVVLSWTSVLGATRYLVEASLDGFKTRFDYVTTDMTSWAPGQVSPAWPNKAIDWRVTPLDAAGQPLAQPAVWHFVKDASTFGEFTAISPVRLLDTRITKQPLGSNRTLVFDVTAGLSPLPTAGVSSVVMNVTVTAPTAPGFLTLYPYNVARPPSSSLNFMAGQTVPNLVTVGVDTNGRVGIYNSYGSSHVILDIVGYYSGGTLVRATRFVPADSPKRILDTRGGTNQVPRPLQAGEVRTIGVAGQGDVPTGATSVVMNVTAVTPTKVGYLTLFPAGVVPTPTASNLNFVPNVTVPNLVSVQLGTGGNVSVLNSAGQTNVLFDVVGWYVAGDPAAGARFNPVTPGRVLDTRLAGSGPKLAPFQPRAVQIRGVKLVPNSTNVTAVVLNVTVTDPDGPGYATVYPSLTTVPTASNLNYLKGQSVPNLVVARVGADGRINLISQASSHMIVDVVGWFGA